MNKKVIIYVIIVLVVLALITVAILNSKHNTNNKELGINQNYSNTKNEGNTIEQEQVEDIENAIQEQITDTNISTQRQVKDAEASTEKQVTDSEALEQGKANDSETSTEKQVTDSKASTKRQNKEEEIDMIKIKVNNNVLDVKLEENEATKSLVERLKNGDISVKANEYGGFEKVGELGFSLPRNDKNITTSAGDIVLYQGNQISLFYNSNSWSYTKLGKVQNVSAKDLKNILGADDVSLVLSLE